MDENTTPLEANLGWVVSFQKGQYIGKDVLIQQKEKGLTRIRIGFVMEEVAIPRQGYEILKDNEKIGKVTSGTFSPILKKGIGMGYVPSEHNTIGNEIQISIRGNIKKARISGMPFYDTSVYGSKRVKK